MRGITAFLLDRARTQALSTQVAALEAGQVRARFRDGVAIPPQLTVLGSASVDVTVTWDVPFPPNTDYVILKPQVTVTPGLIGKVDAVVKSKTAAGCVVTVTTTAVLAAGAGTLSVFAYRPSTSA